MQTSSKTYKATKPKGTPLTKTGKDIILLAIITVYNMTLQKAKEFHEKYSSPEAEKVTGNFEF